MEERKLVPKRRFRGFESEWERHYLNERVEFITGLTYSPNDVVASKGTFVIRSSNIKNNQIIDDDNVYVNPNIVNSEKVKVGDIIVVVRNGSRHLIGKNAVVRKDMHNTVIGAFMTGVRTQYYEYVGTLLNTRLFKRQVSENLGATINQITIGMFSKMKFYFPNEKEQQKIGEFFRVLDDRIANQERKIAKVKALKEAYLTEMFPQEGETVPKRRFKGFEGEWEEKRLAELANVSTGYPFSSKDFIKNGKYTVITNKNIEDQDKGVSILGEKINISDSSMLEKYLLKGVNVLVSMDGDVAKTGRFSSDKSVIAQRVGRVTAKQIEFIYQVTKRQHFIQTLDNLAVGNIIKHISLKQIEEYTFYAPSSENEQQKIGSFFKNLDDQIRVEEAKLEKLKKMKEAYLEEMFV